MGDLFAVLVQGGRLWLRHWPVLLAIALAGGAVRAAALWGAVGISDVNSTLGVLTLVFAPLGSVTAIVLMLYAVRGSMPHISAAAQRRGPEDPTRGHGHERRLLDIMASVLVPFLTVYASIGFLKEDTFAYVNAVTQDEFFNNVDVFWRDDAINPDRTAIATGWVAVAVVACAIVFRFGLAKLEGVKDWTSIGLLGAYVEVLWLATLASQFTHFKDVFWDWAQNRRGVGIFVDGWEHLLTLVGPLAQPLDVAGAWILGVLGDVDDIVVLPGGLADGGCGGLRAQADAAAGAEAQRAPDREAGAETVAAVGW